MKPEQKLKVHTGEKGKDALLILPVFSDDIPSGVNGSDNRNLKKILEKQLKAGFFKAKPGEILNLAHEGLVLAGLGKKKAFHPDRMTALFRSLGNLIAKIENPAHISFSDDVLKAAETFGAAFNAGSADHSGPPRSAEKKEKKAGKKGDKNGSADESEEEEGLDYFLPFTKEEMISQCVSCLIIGADSMDILKTKKKKKDKPARDVTVSADGLKKEQVKRAVERGENLGSMANRARYIASLPGNYISPLEFEKYTRDLAKEFHLKIRVFQADELKKIGCGGIISVGKGSDIPPRMIVLEYTPSVIPAANKQKAQKNLNTKSGPVVLVGKGITFDTGGISLKPSGEMHEMKYDMCGATLVIHAMALASVRKYPHPIVGLVGIAENMPDGKAIKPGDVYTAYNGLTVEIQNTDAEGRLVLGDVLAYACKNYSPSVMLDFATLTGACVIALGHEAAGVMTSSEELASQIDLASRKSLDRSWRLPHWQVYSSGLKSDISDLRNIAGRDAGTVTAYRFLTKFVKPGIRWAHVDIAGMAWRSKDSASQPRGATAWGLRFLNQFIEDL